MLGKYVTLHLSNDEGVTYGTAIGRIQELTIGDLVAETQEDTSYGGDDGYKTYDYGLRDGGEWSMTIRYDAGQTDVDALEAAQQNGEKVYLAAKFGSPINKMLAARFLVTTLGHAVPKDNHVDRTLGLKVDGAVAKTDI